ncbi:hypothetical protein [Sulfurimonas sp.]|uniref:hypothetical protein n=1 Tax=Sulfurimonas sp. TaxID=2022749 RepID=UPI00261EE9F6|nr:hypothetical protein [Sulfurimonas sp.]
MQLKIFIILVLLVIHLSAKEEGSRYSVGLVGMSMDYREYDDNNQILDSEKSDLSGIIGVELGMDYIVNTSAQDYSQVGLHLTTLWGTTEYVGALLNNGGGYGSVVSSSVNTILDVEGEYLYGVRIANNFDAIAGGSVGYRSWRRELSSYQVEVYSWAYLNPEIGLDFTATRDISLRLLLGYKYGLSPIMTATGIKDNFELGSADTFHLSLNSQFNIDETTSLFIEYLYENQVITKSNIVYSSDGTGYLEPDSNANNQYLKFGVAFKY